MLGAIWAQSLDGIIGDGEQMPWHVPEDLAHFKEVTSGHPVIMGRRTWESFPARFRPLPGRRNIVLTRQRNYVAPGAEIAHDLGSALALLDGADAWICGGAQIYTQAMPLADVLVVTEVDADVDGDTHAPEIGPGWADAEIGEWVESRSGYRFRILRYRRAPG